MINVVEAKLTKYGEGYNWWLIVDGNDNSFCVFKRPSHEQLPEILSMIMQYPTLWAAAQNMN